jgi:oligopeptide/dipeptide ABC transporter ATP-binding protein
MRQPLLEIQNLNVGFETNRGLVQPVRDVSINVFPGQTMAIVGESGCGKSVTAMSILRLLPTPPAQYLGGKIIFEGRDLLALSEKEMRSVRGKDIAMIFQEPMTSLNPVYTIGDQIMEAVTLHQNVRGREAWEIAEQSLRDVGIADPKRRLESYPHEMSGGMRQRVMIAMALSCQPKLLIADEPTTALDVTIQAQILELLRKLQAEKGMAMILITHDLGVVAENADVVSVMYASRVVECATVEELFDSPRHPYTEALFKSVPQLGSNTHRLQTISGSVPNPAKFPVGCKFHTRCPKSRELAKGNADSVEIVCDGERSRVLRTCVSNEPATNEITKDHWAACHQLPEYINSQPTVPRLDRKREVVASTTDSQHALRSEEIAK